MMRPPKPRCGFEPGCDITVSLHVQTIRSGLPWRGLSLSLKGQVLSRLKIFVEGFHSEMLLQPVLMASATAIAEKTATRTVVYLAFFMLPVAELRIPTLSIWPEIYLSQLRITDFRINVGLASRTAAPAPRTTLGERSAARHPLC